MGEELKEEKKSIRNVKQHMGADDGFLVQCVYLVFYLAERISVFFCVTKIGNWIHKLWITIYLWRKNLKKDQIENAFREGKYSLDGKINPIPMPFVERYIFPEIWICLNWTYAIVANAFLKQTSYAGYGIWIMFIYSFLRTFEMFVYQINVTFFHRLNRIYLYPKREHAKVEQKPYAIKSATRTVVLMIFNIIEYVLQFAVMYACLAKTYGFAISLQDSFSIFMTLDGFEKMAQKPMGYVVLLEIIIGEIMNILCLGRFIGLLPDVEKIEK